MAIYLKLGENADSFSDPVTRLNMAGEEVAEVSAKQVNSSRTKRALRGGHLQRASSNDYKAWQKKVKARTVEETDKPITDGDVMKKLDRLDARVKELQNENQELKVKLDEATTENNPDDDGEEIVDFEAMDETELQDYYEGNFQVTAKQKKAFEKLSVEDKIKELESLESSE